MKNLKLNLFHDGRATLPNLPLERQQVILTQFSTLKTSKNCTIVQANVKCYAAFHSLKKSPRIFFFLCKKISEAAQFREFYHVTQKIILKVGAEFAKAEELIAFKLLPPIERSFCRGNSDDISRRETSNVIFFVCLKTTFYLISVESLFTANVIWISLSQ